MEIRVLGAVEVRSGDGTIREIALQQRRLLAALATQTGQVRSTDALVHALWGEELPTSAGKVLQVYVSRLRKQLPPSARIDTRGGGYVLEVDATSLDALRFEQLLKEGRAAMQADNPALALSRLRRALALWRGPAYADFRDEEFARVEAERLEELRVVALEERNEAELAVGRDNELLPELQALAAARPTRERLQAQLMLSLYRAGRQPEALDVYAYTRRTLRDELGLEPGVELRELQRQILRQDPALDRKSTSAAPAVAVPDSPNRLLGRERELVELCDLLARDDVRMLVLTGAGGSGKTRLALEAAREAAPLFANGAVFIDLSPLRDPQLVAGAIARALGLRELVEDPLEAVAEALRPLEQLLLVDNAEHLRAAAPIFVQLLTRAPRLTFLVTSRVVLHVSGEHVYPVEPLAGEAAVALFWERAREADSHLESSRSDEENIRQICARLDGLPLAIELAAGWVRTLFSGELLARLDPRLPLLVGGPTDLPARQQTVRATLDWSFGLLDEDERRDLYALSVFAGGCTLDAAEAVCGASIDRLSALVDHSLLRHDRGGCGSRYSMLETIREFAHEQLGGNAAHFERRHAEYVLAVGGAGDSCTGSEREAALQRLAQELDNLRAAIAWALKHDSGIALRLAWVASLFQPTAGELRRWLDTALSLRTDAPDPSRARVLHAAAHLAGSAEETERARDLWRQALELYREFGNDAGAARALAGLGLAASQDGDYEAARRLYDESMAVYRALGDQGGEWIVTNNLGELERSAGNYERASVLLEHAVAIATEAGDTEAAAMSLQGLGDLALAQDELSRASAHYLRAISIGTPLAGGRRNLCWSLAALASVAAARGEVDRAGVLWGSAEALEEQLDLRLPAHVRRHYRRPLDELEPEPLRIAIANGRALALADAVALALRDAPEAGPAIPK